MTVDDATRGVPIGYFPSIDLKMVSLLDTS